MGLFSRKSGSLLGVDIGATAVALVELSHVHGSCRLDAWAVEALPDGATAAENISDAAAVGATIRRAAKRAGCRARRAAFAVPSSVAVTKTIDMDASLGDRELEVEVVLEADRHLPFGADEILRWISSSCIYRRRTRRRRRCCWRRVGPSTSSVVAPRWSWLVSRPWRRTSRPSASNARCALASRPSGRCWRWPRSAPRPPRSAWRTATPWSSPARHRLTALACTHRIARGKLSKIVARGFAPAASLCRHAVWRGDTALAARGRGCNSARPRRLGDARVGAGGGSSRSIRWHGGGRVVDAAALARQAPRLATACGLALRDFEADGRWRR